MLHRQRTSPITTNYSDTLGGKQCKGFSQYILLIRCWQDALNTGLPQTFRFHLLSAYSLAASSVLLQLHWNPAVFNDFVFDIIKIQISL